MKALLISALLLFTPPAAAQSTRCDRDGCYDVDPRGRSDSRETYQDREYQRNYNEQRGYPPEDYHGSRNYRQEYSRQHRNDRPRDDGPDDY
jgi:hypothetical protein